MPPFSWDMTKMRETKKSTGGAADRKFNLVKIARLVQLVVIDGVLNEEVWKKTAIEELAEIGSGAPKENSSFQVAYDDTSLYFSFVCQFADVAQAKFSPLGRDRECWNNECLEIFLDPLGTREKYYHFIFNPVPESFYDTRFGYIEDLLDPGHDKEDKSWNGVWEYAAKVDKENKRWTAEVEIPYNTLGVTAPKPGVKWTMNIGREHYYLNKETGKTDCELSLWSPNMEERSFCAPRAFGTLEFE